ncbi:MAG: hypothetical protein ACYTGB_03015 [Planctomycetota bacterium]|jgi:hypothetical protein
MTHVQYEVRVERLSPAEEHFFFGYYDRLAVSAEGRWHLALNPSFRDRPNTGADAAPLGVLDLAAGNEWTELEESPAWNWQMGCCSQWVGPDPTRTFVYNVREGTRAFGRLYDIEMGALRDFELPIYDAAADGSFGISLNFARLHVCRPGYGYPDIDDPWAGQPAPDDDGLRRVDLDTGRSELIVSLAQVRGVDTPPGAAEGLNWLNHVMVSPDGTRLMFIHRWQEEGQWRSSRLFSCRPDGSELGLVNPGPGVSHCDWLGEDRILSWCTWGGHESAYRIMDLTGGEPEVVGAELLPRDGHCSFRPGGEGRWLLTDEYPGEDEQRTLLLFDRELEFRYDLGRFPSPRGEQVPLDIRCDLHPRWHGPRPRVTFDSIHEGYRGVYTADLGNLIS